MKHCNAVKSRQPFSISMCLYNQIKLCSLHKELYFNGPYLLSPSNPPHHHHNKQWQDNLLK